MDELLGRCKKEKIRGEIQSYERTLYRPAVQKTKDVSLMRRLQLRLGGSV